MTTRTTNALGCLAAALLFLGMFAGLFGGGVQVAKWGTRFACGACGWETKQRRRKGRRCGV